MISKPTKATRRRRGTSHSEVFSLDGRLDAAEAKRFARSFGRMVDKGMRECLIDLTGVESIDSSGFGSLVAAARKMESAGGRTAVACANPTMRRLFEISGLARLVPIMPTIEDARVRLSLLAGHALAS